MPRRLQALLAGLLGLAGAALAGEPSAPAGQPLKLTLGVNDVFCQDTACECVHQTASRQYGDFLARLRERHGIELELVYFAEPYDLENAMQADRFDGAISKPWLLLRHQDGRGRHLRRIADVQDTSGNALLWGTVIVLRDSPIRSLRDAAGQRLALGDADGYEKHHAVFALLKREGVDFPAGRRVEKASCLECLDLLLKGDVDVAVISSYALVADCAADVARPNQFRTIAETVRIPLTSLMLDRRRVSAEDAARLQRALLELSRTALPASMHGGGFIAPQPWQPPELPEPAPPP
jgi:ABC-type phosphate/phosphonate transport system substrate-binding protein